MLLNEYLKNVTIHKISKSIFYEIKRNSKITEKSFLSKLLDEFTYIRFRKFDRLNGCYG